MGTQAIKPWTDLVGLHPDVEAGNLPDSVFAIDLGTIDEANPEVPAVNRALKKAISKGVGDGQFAWFNGPAPQLGADDKLQITHEKIVFGNPLSEDEIDFDSGWLVMPVALPAATQAPQPPSQIQERPGVAPAATGGQPVVQPVGGAAATCETGGPSASRPKVVSFKFKATRDQIFKAFPAIANLADKSDGGQIAVQVEGTSQSDFDLSYLSWLRNAVEEPLDESNVETQ